MMRGRREKIEKSFRERKEKRKSLQTHAIHPERKTDNSRQIDRQS